MTSKARYLPYVAVSQRRTSQQEAARRTAHASMQPQRHLHGQLRRWWQRLVQTFGGANR